jgi:ATP-grasp domain-containing protein
VESPERFEQVMDLWQADPILRWQRIVVREFIPLRLVGIQSPTTLPKSFEFRTFWWKGRCVGFGPYWTGEHYTCTPQERSAATAVAGVAAERLGVTFLVVDVAQTQDGPWIVIEVNDGQDSGYAGVHPLAMWRGVLEELSAARS